MFLSQGSIQRWGDDRRGNRDAQVLWFLLRGRARRELQRNSLKGADLAIFAEFQEDFLRLDQPAPLLLAHEDRAFIAASKAAGQLFHGYTRGLPLTLVDQLKDKLQREGQKTGSAYLGVVHRLDRPVSGLALFARNSKVAARLSEQVQSRTLEKVYLALVEGEPPAGPLHLVDRLPRLAPEPGEAGSQDPGEEQDCSLFAWRLGSVAGLSLLAIKLETGRRHQIRRQLALRAWPIVGDSTYGAHAVFPGSEDCDGRFRPIGLHAAALGLKHPISYLPMLLKAPVPRFWEAASPALRARSNVFLTDISLGPCGTIEGLTP